MRGTAHTARSIALAGVVALAVASTAARGSAQAVLEPAGVAEPAVAAEEAAAAYDASVRDAVAAYEARDFERALAAFERAFEILPTPRVLRGMGMCQIELGRFADAHRSLRAALDADGGERGLDAELRANVENVLLPLVRSHLALWVVPERVTVTVDGIEASPDENRVVAIDPGTHELLVRADDGRSAHATVEARPGHVGPLPLSLPEPRPVEPPAPRVRVVPAVSVVQDRGLGDYTPHEVRTRFAMWAHGTLGAWQGGSEYSPAAGVGLTLALMTRYVPEISMGGQLEGTWAGLLDTCGPYVVGSTVVRTSETCAWFRTSVRIAIEAHAPDMPISFVLAGGPGLGGRSTQGPDEHGVYRQSVRIDPFVALDGGLRWYLADDVVILGADVRSAIGDYADVGVAVLVGVQMP